MENITNSTKNIYEENLARLKKNNIDYIHIDNDDVDDLIDNIKKTRDIGDSGLRTYLCAILWYHKNNDSENILLDKINKKITDINKKMTASYDKNIMNEKETECYLDWDEIKQVFYKLYEKRNKSQISFKKCIIIGLYVLFPPRRIKDYSHMKIVENISDSDKKFNYYVKNNKQFVFSDYKTKKKYGSQIFDIIDELCILLNEYITKYDLISKELIGMRETDLSEKIKNIFFTETGKNTSVNTIRHSFINYMIKHGKINSTEERKKYSNMMGHSDITQQNIYRKII